MVMVNDFVHVKLFVMSYYIVSVDERPPKKMKKQLQFTDILAQEEQKEMIVVCLMVYAV